MIRLHGFCAAVDETAVVSAPKDNEEVEMKGGVNIIKEWSMPKGSTESHPIHEQVGLVRLHGRHDATLGRFHCSK